MSRKTNGKESMNANTPKKKLNGFLKKKSNFKIQKKKCLKVIELQNKLMIVLF